MDEGREHVTLGEAESDAAANRRQGEEAPPDEAVRPGTRPGSPEGPGEAGQPGAAGPVD